MVIRFLNHSYKPLVAIFFVSIIFTLSFWVILPSQFQRNESSDFVHIYEPVARNILSGGGIVDGNGNIATRTPPGYPIILAGILWFAEFLYIPQAIAVKGFILVCGGLTSVLIFMIARSIWSAPLSLIPVIGWTTYPLSLWFTKQPNSEIPFMVFFYAALYVFWKAILPQKRKWYSFFLVGILLGISMLIRPLVIGIGFVFVLAVWFVCRRDSLIVRLSIMFFLLLGNLLVVLPWELWVYSNTGDLILLSTADISSVRDGLKFGLEDEGREGIKVSENVSTLMQKLAIDVKPFHSPREALAIVFGEFRTQPTAVIKLVLLKAIRCWYGTDSQRFEDQIRLVQIPYLALIILGFIYNWRQKDRRGDFTFLVCSVVLYFWMMDMLVLSIIRYMVPVFGLLFILTPAFFETIIKSPGIVSKRLTSHEQ